MTVITNDITAPSARFKEAVKQPHEVVFYAESLLNGVVMQRDLPIVGGSVDADRNNVVRRTAEVMIGDRKLIPSKAKDPLAPYGQELRIKRGIRYANGDIEYLTIFLGGIQTSVWDSSLGAINVSCADRMQRLVDSKTYQPRSVAKQWPHPNNDSQGRARAVDIIDVFYSHVLYPIPEAYTLPVSYHHSLSQSLRTTKGATVEEDPLQDVILPLVKTWGAEMYAGTDGLCHLVPVPDVRTGVPVFDCAAGEGGVLISANAGLSREGTVNFVTVFSNQLNNASPPVWWTSRDANPNSPTFASSFLTINGEYTEEGVLAGQFGRQSMQVRSETATTRAQCKTEADAILRNNLGAVHSADFTSLPATWITPGQVIRIRFPGFSENHILDSVHTPLTEEDPITGSTRSYTLKLVV